MPKHLFAFAFALLVIIGLTNPFAAHAATTPTLGDADTYGVLSSTFTANTGLTTITGDVGYTTLSGSGTISVSGSTVTPVPPQAVTDQNAALSALNAETCDFTFTGVFNIGTDTTHGPLGVYTPGTYCSTGAMNLDAGATITLTGTGTYLFRSLGALDTSAGSIVALSGASACDVFWTGVGATTLGANSTFAGTVIDNAGITIGSTVDWTGRALAGGGTVTSDTDTITVPTGCTPPTPPPSPSPSPSPSSPGSGGSPSFIPLIALVKVPTPLALPDGPGLVTYDYVVTNPSIQALNDVTLTDDMCAPVTLLAGDLNGDNLLDPNESWEYRCTMTLSVTTTNTAIATGYGDGGVSVIATAIATVVVDSPLAAPLINIIKVPSRLTPFPYGGGSVMYTYTVTNPGIVAIHDVTVADDKCMPVNFISGDRNGDNLLDSDESWTYGCQTTIASSTRNIATVSGTANGYTALGYAFAVVLVAAPGLPNTGIPLPMWNIIILTGIMLLALGLFVFLKKHAHKA